MKYLLNLLFLVMGSLLLLAPVAACAGEALSPVAALFDGKDTVKFLVCAGYPQGESYEDTVEACQEKTPGSYLVLKANGKGYYVTDNDERHKARFTWSRDEDADGSISVIRGTRELGYGFYRNKYANGYGSADSDLPLALEKE